MSRIREVHIRKRIRIQMGQSKLNKPKEVTPQIGKIGIPPKRSFLYLLNIIFLIIKNAKLLIIAIFNFTILPDSETCLLVKGGLPYHVDFLEVSFNSP